MRTWLEELTLRTVIVHTRTDRSFKGVLAAVHADGLVLRDAQLVGESEDVLDGSIFILRPNVDFMQVLGGPYDHTSDG